MQETKHTWEDWPAMAHQLQAAGFHAVSACCRITPKQGRSAGVVLAWRRHLAVVQHQVQAEPSAAAQGRHVAVTLRLHPFGEVNIHTLYGWDGQVHLTKQLLHEVLTGLSGYHLIIGDINMTVEQSQA
jgi:hypothetical protein